MKIVFVILHYLAIDETYKSVDSIEKKIDTDMYKIVIVDNASPDKSGALLKEHYKNDDHVEVLLNQENLGFARGNNVGFRYAEKTWNPSYIVLMNNDVYLLDDDFLEKVEKEYKRSQFAVLGPMILSADGRCDHRVPFIFFKVDPVFTICDTLCLFKPISIITGSCIDQE